LVEEELRYNDIALSCDNDKTIKRDNDKTIKRDNGRTTGHDNGRTTECRNLLLTAYTNRAVDEICGMLEGSGQDYLRLGNEASCDPRYADRLLSSAFADHPKLSDIRRRLEQVPIVVATTSTLQARPFILALKHFSLCIVDEASQILEPNIIGLLSSDRIDRFILIGDHKQLPAVVQQADDDLHLHACRLSLFERLLQQEREAGRQEFTGILNHQGRMHPDIASFPNEMFYHSEQLQPVPCPHQLATSLAYQKESEDATDDLLKQHRVLFLPSTDEAVIVADLLRRIYRQIGADHFDADHSIGVIVTYRYQIAQIRQEMKKVGIPALLDISIDTVERYQGSQRDVIIYSIGAQSAADLEFLTSQCFEEAGRVIDRKLNVAMTRAREQLLMTGNADVLRRNDIFNELLNRYSI
jgi:superfamily I DNA and/or RNA helicase